MIVELRGSKVQSVVYEEDGESTLTIYWKDGNKTKCIIREEL
jgi:hypothetical protein